MGAPVGWRLTLGAADGPSALRECEGLRGPAADQTVRRLMRLETSRLVIRSFAISDIPQYAKIVSDPRVTRYLADGLPHSYREAENYIRDCMRRDEATGVTRYAVVRKSEGDLIGFCGFKELDDHIDFGWRYAQHTWSQGYGTEAALAVLDYGVRALRLRNIAATTFTANVASLRIIRKLGFRRAFEGEHHGRRTVRYDQQESQWAGTSLAYPLRRRCDG